jgi:hypothetical protein
MLFARDRHPKPNDYDDINLRQTDLDARPSRSCLNAMAFDYRDPCPLFCPLRGPICVSVLEIAARAYLIFNPARVSCFTFGGHKDAGAWGAMTRFHSRRHELVDWALSPAP